MARPLLKIENLTRTHTLNVFPEEVHVQVHYPSQTLTNRMKLTDVSTINITRDPTQLDPQYCMVTVKGGGRKSFEIPEMETYKARELKSTIDTQKLNLLKQASQGPRNKSNFSAGLKSLPVLRKRF